MDDKRSTMSTQIFHNPNCSTSRNTLALMQASGEQPEIIDYLNHPPTHDDLTELLAQMQMSPRELMRSKEAIYTELGLDDAALSDDQLIDAMTAHPILINRPIVITDKGAVLARPIERVFEVLSHPVTQFTKENGDVISYDNA